MHNINKVSNFCGSLQLSNASELLLVKILKNYYQAVFNKNADEVKVISDVLEKAGWKDFVSVLPHLNS